MEENKQTICDLLLLTLQSTRGGKNLVSLAYDSEDDGVLATFKNGYTKYCTVAGSSGTASIRDIMRQLDV